MASPTSMLLAPVRVFLQRPQRRLAVDVVALRRVSLEHHEPVIRASRDRNTRLRPTSEVAPDLLRIARPPPLRAAAVLSGLVGFLVELARRFVEGDVGGEDIPNPFGLPPARGPGMRLGCRV